MGPLRRRAEEIQGHAKGDASSITNIEALEEIVNYYFDHERYDDALQFVDRLLTLVPYSADNWQRKGLILSNLGKFDDALELL